MSDSDKSTKEPDIPRANWMLPEVIDINIRLVKYDPPKLRNFNSKFAIYDTAIEFIVKTDNPIPVRALSPAIFVNDVQIIEGEVVDKTTIRFLSFEPDLLQENAPILWGWQDDPKEFRKKTGFQFQRPDSAD